MGLIPFVPLSLVVVRALVPSRFHFPASLGSRQFPVLRRYYGRSDFLRMALRLFPSMNTIPAGGEVHCLRCQRFLPFCLQSCDVRDPGFSLVSVFGSPSVIGFGLGPFGAVSFRSLGRGSRLRAYPARSPVTSHRIEFTAGPHEPCVTDWHFASSCSPRSDYAAAVSFRYGHSDSCPTGTFTPLRCHFHSRTRSPLRGLG